MKKILLLSAICLSAAAATATAPVIVDGHARFTILTPTLIRTEYAGDGVFENRRSFNVVEQQVEPATPVTNFTTTVVDGWREIHTDRLTLRYRQGSGIFDTTNLVVTLPAAIVAKPWSATATAFREEAENARLFGGARTATDHKNYDGTGFVAGLKTVGAGIEWTARKNLPAGEYTLSIKYSSGKGTQTISLYVDGKKTPITLPATVDWDEWKYYRQPVTLDFGMHTFQLLCDAGDTYNVNIDRLTLSPVFDVDRLAEAEDALLAGGLKLATDHGGFSGAGFVAGYQQTGAAATWEVNNTHAAGEYVLSLKYSNGLPADGQHIVRTLSLYVDDTKTQLAFNPTADWEHWDILQTTIALPAGRHSLRLAGDAGDNLHVNIDWLAISTPGAALPGEHLLRQTNNLGAWSRGLDTKRGAIPLWDGILSRDGWYLLDDSGSALWDDNTDWIVDRPAHAGGYQDGYFFGYGTDYPTALADFYRITGRPVLLPKWAFGVWFSKNDALSQADYQSTLVPQFRAERVPLDVLVVDTDWKSPERWNGWNWNTTLFPDPQGFMEWTRAQGLVVPLNVHPTINNNDPKFAATNTAAGGLIADGNKYHFDFSRKPHAEAYLSLLQPFNAQGVRFWWNDQAEKPRSEVQGAPADTWINHLYTRDAEVRGLRGFAFSRIGSGDTGYSDGRTPGVAWSEHRYTLHFTGDAYDTWEMLAFQSTFTIREANIGIPYVSHDLGSYHANRLSDDMYIRWLQFGVFQPIFRLHSKHGLRLPWEYPAVAEAAKALIRLRHALVPYTYTLAAEAAAGGLPIVRGMYWSYPEAPEAYAYDKQYFYGDHLLVAPIATAGATASTEVWFPEGQWTNFFTGARMNGGQVASVSADYHSMPVFVRAGGIVPLAPYSDSVGQTSGDTLTLRVYTGADGSFALYEDEGDNLDYRSGQSTTTPISYVEQEKRLSIAPRRGAYAGAIEARAYDIEFHNMAAAPQRITVNGAALNPVDGETVRFADGVVYVHLNKRPVATGIDIIIDDNTGLTPVTPCRRGIRLSPNPATDLLTVEAGDDVRDFVVAIYNAEGEEVFNRPVSGTNRIGISTRAFAKGIYIVKVADDGGTFAGKLIVR
jgi:hypothetical protein